MNIIAKQIRRSFALRLSLSIVVIATIVFVVAIGELFYRSRIATREAAISQATQVLSNVTQHMTALLSEVEVATHNTEWQVLENLRPDALLQLSRNMVELNPILDGCSIAMPIFSKIRVSTSPPIRRVVRIILKRSRKAMRAIIILAWTGIVFPYSAARPFGLIPSPTATTSRATIGV